MLRGAAGGQQGELRSDEIQWMVLAEGSWGMGTEVTATAAETCALLSAVLSFESLRKDGHISLYYCEGASGLSKAWQSHG